MANSAGAARRRHVPDREFASALTLARSRAGWSLGELANRTGLSRSFLCLLEHGRRAPSVVTVAWLVAALPLTDTEVTTFVQAGVRGVGRHWQTASGWRAHG